MVADVPRAETFSVGRLVDRQGWRRVSFGDVVRNSDSYVRDPVAAGIERFVGLDHLDSESLRVRRWGQVADGTTFTRSFAPGQVLFGKRRAYQRKVAVADFHGICSGDILVFEPAIGDLLPELLPFIVQSEGFFQHALGTSAGSLSPRTRWGDLAKYEFLLPPMGEQRLIAEILTVADQERDALFAVQETLRVLARQLGDNLFHHSGSAFATLGSMASDGILEFQTGPFGTLLKASSYCDEGTPLINPVNIVNGSLITENGPFLPPAVCERLGNYRLLEGDLVLGRKGDVGRALYISAAYEGFILGTDCIRLRLLSTNVTRPEYLYRIVASPTVHEWLAHNASGTTMPGINERILRGIRVPILSVGDQQHIVRAFERVDLASLTVRSHISRGRDLVRVLRTGLMSGMSTLLPRQT